MQGTSPAVGLVLFWCVWLEQSPPSPLTDVLVPHPVKTQAHFGVSVVILLSAFVRVLRWLHLRGYPSQTPPPSPLPLSLHPRSSFASSTCPAPRHPFQADHAGGVVHRFFPTRETSGLVAGRPFVSEQELAHHWFYFWFWFWCRFWIWF